MSLAFESSAAGAVPDDSRLECGVCWWVYDPTIGEDTWDTPPGTPFAALPSNWRCPSCDAPKSKFMALTPGRAPTRSKLATLEERTNDLIKAFESAEEGMVGLPIHNDLLEIAAIGFRDHGDHYFGIMATPWSMNLTLVPKDPGSTAPGPLGASRTHTFPSGQYSFIIGRMEGVGIIETCSLFSPMDEFDDPDVVRAVAESALDGVFETPEPQPKKTAVSRRFLLTLNGEAQ